MTFCLIDIQQHEMSLCESRPSLHLLTRRYLQYLK